jgi:hypothetical protein
MYDCAPEKARFLVYGDCRDAIRLSFCEFIIDDGVAKSRKTFVFRHAGARRHPVAIRYYWISVSAGMTNRKNR